MGQVGAQGRAGPGGLDQPAVWGEGQPLFGIMLADGRGGVDGTGRQQQLRDLGDLSGTTEGEALWAIERDLGQCPGAPWRGSAGISQDGMPGAAAGAPRFHEGRLCRATARTSTWMRRSGAGRERRPLEICAWEAGPRCRRGSAASSPVWPAGAARSNGAAGRCCNRRPKRSCQIPSPIPGVRQMHIPPWPWFRHLLAPRRERGEHRQSPHARRNRRTRSSSTSAPLWSSWRRSRGTWGRGQPDVV